MTAWMFLAFIGAGAIFLVIFNTYVYYRGLGKIKKELAHFTYVEEYDCYAEAEPQFSIQQPKQPYGVLLFHGFTLSAQVFSPLFPALKEAGINYYAPTFTGFGIQSPVLLAHVSYKDWVRDAIEAYDVLAQTVEKVHVVGLSLGGAIGTILSRYRNVDKLILLSPAMYLESELQRIVWMSNIPAINIIARIFYPFYTKQMCRPGSRLDLCSVKTTIGTFHNTTIPIHVARAVDMTLKHIDFDHARFKQLVIFYGKQDRVADIPRFIKELDKEKIPYTSKCYEKSAHILTLDFDSKDVVQDLLLELQETIPKLTYEDGERDAKKLPKPSSKSNKTR